jgi:hypothetical protein
MYKHILIVHIHVRLCVFVCKRRDVPTYNIEIFILYRHYTYMYNIYIHTHIYTGFLV